MTGMDGINSLQKMLGALQVKETTNVNGAAAAKGGSSSTAALASTAGSANLDHASFSASGMAAMSTDMSDVRTTKVAELRQAIANGTYNVPASAVADKMVENMLG